LGLAWIQQRHQNSGCARDAKSRSFDFGGTCSASGNRCLGGEEIKFRNE